MAQIVTMLWKRLDKPTYVSFSSTSFSHTMFTNPCSVYKKYKEKKTNIVIKVRRLASWLKKVYKNHWYSFMHFSYFFKKDISLFFNLTAVSPSSSAPSLFPTHLCSHSYFWVRLNWPNNLLCFEHFSVCASIIYFMLRKIPLTY